jgi:hypothetical protein
MEQINSFLNIVKYNNNNLITNKKMYKINFTKIFIKFIKISTLFTLLTGCSEMKAKNFMGMQNTAPDEYTVFNNKPLIIPNILITPKHTQNIQNNNNDIVIHNTTSNTEMPSNISKGDKAFLEMTQENVNKHK